MRRPTTPRPSTPCSGMSSSVTGDASKAMRRLAENTRPTPGSSAWSRGSLTPPRRRPRALPGHRREKPRPDRPRRCHDRTGAVPQPEGSSSSRSLREGAPKSAPERGILTSREDFGQSDDGRLKSTDPTALASRPSRSSSESRRSTATSATGRTLGELAASELNEIRNLGIGRPVPRSSARTSTASRSS